VETNKSYSTGDWVVHSHYGVGQINRIDVKPIHGEDIKCFKVKTKDSIYWFATTDTGNPRIRPIASQEIIPKVANNLRRKAGKLDTDRKYWKKRIDEVKSDGDMLSIGKLIRDLSAVDVLRGLNDTEEKALEHLIERLSEEWASSTKEGVEKIRSEIYAHILESKAKIKVDG